MTKEKRLIVLVSEETLKKIEEQRGLVPRSAFIRDAILEKLD